MASILLVAVVFVGTGLGEHTHRATSHAHAHAHAAASAACQGTALDSESHTPHDGPCLTCVALHAPFAAAAVTGLDVRMQLSVDRVMALQAQRIDATVPAPRGCRGPPAV